jgi:IclR family pca regulon transcriptional regulator
MATPRSISTIKSFGVLRAFRRRGEVLTTAQLSRRTGLPASSVRRLLLTLLQIGGVERVEQARYRLGPLLHSLGRSTHVPDCLLGAARAPLSELQRRLGLPVAMAVLDGYMSHYIDVLAEGAQPPVERGARYESYSSAAGRVLLASLPPCQIERFLQGGDLIALTPFTVTAPKPFLDLLAQVRRQGYAVEREETRLGQAGVAVPVRDDYGKVFAAICASDASCHLSDRDAVALAGHLTETADRIRRRLFPAAALQGPAAARAQIVMPPARAPQAQDGHAPYGVAAE